MKPSIVRLGSIIAAVFGSVVCVHSQSPQLGLPEVNVTAPGMAPPAKPRDPMIGKWRNEEDKFVEMPCGTTRLTAAALNARCLVGYRLTTGMGPTGGQSVAPCDMGLDVVIYTSGNLAVEADILSFDPYKVSASDNLGKYCFIAPRDNTASDFQDVNQITRRGSNFRNLTQTADGNASIEFTEGRRHCLAFQNLGPVWRGGRSWVMHVSICRTDGLPVSEQDRSRTTNALLIRVYDPIGNLRPPPDNLYSPSK